MSTKITTPHSEEDVKSLKIADLRRYAIRVSGNLDEILNLKKIYCHQCDDWHLAGGFYADKRYKSGFYPICKECLQKEAMDYNAKTKEYTDSREKTIKVFQKLDLPFIDSVYRTALKRAQEEAGDRNRKSAYGHLLTMVKTLDQYRNLHFEDSEFGDNGNPAIVETEEEINENSKLLKTAKKRFGSDYSNRDLVFLETQYEDWTNRYACESKAQELLFQRICHKQLEIEKAQKRGDETKDLDKTLQDLMASIAIKPNQSSANALTESKSFGQLIQKWEDEYEGGNPIPEPDEDFKDVDKIGLYIDVFFKGHLSKMMGLKNAFSNIYEKFMKKYTVNKPQYDEEADSEALFDQIFGAKADGE